MPAKRAKKRTRTRFSAEDAKEAILGATEKRLRDVGPQGLRLQEIARDVGLSHATVLHHVGSRDALVEAVATRATDALERDLLACFESLTPDADALDVTRDTLDRVDTALRRRGHARIFAWLALTKMSRPRHSLFADLAMAVHAAQKSRRPDASLEDARFDVLLVAAAMFGVAIVGPELLQMLGLTDSEQAHARFRAWFAAILVEHAGLEEA